MTVFAVIAYAAFFIVALGWRTVRQYRRTGDTGFRGLSGGARARVASLLFLSGFVATGLGAISQLREPSTTPAALAAAGIVALVAGFALTIVAQLQMGDSWRIGVDQSESTTLVTHGVFGYARNPVFTGMLLALWGVTFLVPTPITFAGAFAASIGLDVQVRLVEEPYLLATHGDEYGRYASRVGRFIPFIGRLRA